MPDVPNRTEPPDRTATPERNGTSPFERRTGEGVDRKIEKKTFTPKRIALALAALLFVSAVGYGLWRATSGGKRLNVERDKLTVSQVEEGPFQEFIAVTGTVTPLQTVYLDAVEGGRVEEVFVQEGAMVEEGDPLLRLSNNDLQLRLMQNEAALSEQVSNLQNMRFQIEQNRLTVRQQIAEADYRIRSLGRDHARNEQLYEKQLISEQEYLETKDELEYQNRRRDLTLRSYQQDSLSQQIRLDQMATSVEQMRRNFGVLQETLANLTVRAPVAGQLTALDAEIGEIRSPGSRFGQIDVLDGFKVRAQIDEFYIERVQHGQTATTQAIAGRAHTLSVTRVYPQVREGRFEVDLTFDEAAPEGIRRGQTIRLQLVLGDPEEAVLLARGGFYQTTGGGWVYAVNASGEEATKRFIRLGRQNPEYFEVLDGLQPGDRVVTSSYETFGDADRLVFD